MLKFWRFEGICVRKFSSKKPIYNETGVENRLNWWLFLRKPWILVQIQNLKLALIFRKLFGRFLILEQQNYLFKLLFVFQELHINFNVLWKFINLCWAAFMRPRVREPWSTISTNNGNMRNSLFRKFLN